MQHIATKNPLIKSKAKKPTSLVKLFYSRLLLPILFGLAMHSKMYVHGSINLENVFIVEEQPLRIKLSVDKAFKYSLPAQTSSLQINQKLSNCAPELLLNF